MCNIVAPDLPDEVFVDTNNLQGIPVQCPSPTGNSMKQTLNDSIKMLVAARQPDPSQLQLTEAKLQAQVSKNKDDSFQRLLETKRKLKIEDINYSSFVSKHFSVIHKRGV